MTTEVLDKVFDKHEGKVTPIQRFFSNKNILLTGGTGFLGMLLLQKLLFSCPDISRIFLLVRKKKGKQVQTRLDELFEDVVYSKLKIHFPDFRQRIIAIEGDCELPELGLSESDKEMLIKEVDIIFHGAATVRFDETLKRAAIINVRAVRDILKLAQQMTKLKSFIHISTAFSNCIHSLIKEEVYSPAMSYKELLNLTEALPENILTSITPMLLGEFPNTYSYTKQIGEDVVKQEGGGLPIGIHRPSIVISTYREPLEGWINNLYGPTGLITGGGVGLIRAVRIDPEIHANVVPADMVVNSIIASAWDVAENFVKDEATLKDLPVYNFEGCRGPKLTWDNYIQNCIKFGSNYYTVKSIWYMVTVPCRTQLTYTIIAFFLHTVPAVIVDGVRFCIRKPPMMWKVYKKIDKMAGVLDYFKLRAWSFESENLSGLITRMCAEDRKIFFCDMKDMNWEEYLEFYVKGIRLYLLNDPMETLSEGRKHLRRLYWTHQLTKAILLTIFLWILWCLFI